MPVVRVRENEPPEVSIRRFKRACEKAGLLTELRDREHYTPPSVERQRAAAAARKRHQKKKAREQIGRSDH